MPDGCPLCHNEPEDGFHDFLSCLYIINVWCFTFLGNNFGDARSFVDWWSLVVSRRTDNEVEIRVVMLWNIWQIMNVVVWNDK